MDDNTPRYSVNKSCLIMLSLLLGVGLLLCVVGFYAIRDFMNLDMHASYMTYAEALEDKADHRGWIREYVPSSAIDIQESHNLDTNEQWLRFNFAPDDLPAMLEKLKPISVDEVHFPRTVSTRHRNWWPNALRAYSENLESTYDFYTHEHILTYGDGRQESLISYIAIDTKTNTVWSWDRRWQYSNSSFM